MEQNSHKKRTSKNSPQRPRTGPRIQVACISCKERKLKCDGQVPACAHCRRYGLICLVEDPATKRHQPRNYLQTLEERVALLESQLLQHRHADVASLSVGTKSTYDHSGSAPKGNDTDDAVSELASKVGLLGLNAAGAEPHYLGSSSAFAFSRIISTSLRRLIPGKPNAVLGPANDGPSPPWPCLLPNYDVGMTFSNAYFQNIHPQYPFLHEPTFRRWEMEVMRPEGSNCPNNDFVPLFFINMVYAVGALLLPSSEYLAQQLYISAQIYIDHVLSFDNLEAIQAILCCAMYSLRSPTGPSIWKLSGLALRQCIELGYHRSTRRLGSNYDPLRLEMRKRAFWCAYGIDCSASINLGRPLGIAYQEIDAEFPMDINDSDITSVGMVGTPRTSNEAPTTTSTAIHVFRIRCLWARIHTSLYSDTTLCNPSHPTYANRTAELRTELDDWLASVPPAITRVNDALSIFGSRDWYNQNYNYSIMLLYRAQLTSSTDVAEKVCMECLRAAENFCHGYRRQYIGRPINYTWGALLGLFTAGLTYLHCLWAFPAAREAVRHEDVISTCTDCTIVLVVMGERWAGAAPYRDIFEALASRTMSMIVDKNQGPCGATTLADGVDQGQWEQWMGDIADVRMSDGLDQLLTGLVGEYTAGEVGSPGLWEELMSG